MDILTLAVFGLFLAILVARIVEIAVKRPQTFRELGLELGRDLRGFAEPTTAAAETRREGEVVDLPPRNRAANGDAYYEPRLSA